MEIKSPNQIYQDLEKMNEAKEYDKAEQIDRIEKKLDDVLSALNYLTGKNE